MINKYIDDNPNKSIIATGDTNQLETIEKITNQLNYDDYMNHCIDMMFPSLMYFQENKRLKSNDDKEILKRFTEDIFNKAIPPETTIRKYFEFVKKVKTRYNIAYKNKTCIEVSRGVRTRLGKTADYEKLREGRDLGV